MPVKKSAKGGSASGGKTKKAAAKKASAKKAVKKAAPKAKKSKQKPIRQVVQTLKSPQTRRAQGKLLGKVDHYFDKIGVAAMKLGDSLKVGDTLRIEGGSVAFTQQIASMQIEHEAVQAAKKGDEVGFKVKQKVREGYRVFKLPRPLV